MKAPSLELLVGLFVILGIGAVFVLTFRVASLSGTVSGNTFSVTASFTNIGSLKPGAPVTVGGVRFGRVRDIRSVYDNFEALVTMDIDDSHNNLPVDSSAKILTSGMLGEEYVGIDPGGDNKSLAQGGTITLTQSALVLEDIVGKFMTSSVASKPAAACK